MDYRNFTREDISSYMENQMKQIFLKLSLELFVTAFVIYLVATTSIFDGLFRSGIYRFLPFVLIGLVFMIGRQGAYTMNATTLVALSTVYSVITGLTIAPFVIYYIDLAIYAFAVTILIFIIMAVYGYTTKKPLYKLQTFLFVSLIALLIANIVAIFIKIPLMYTMISYAGALIFTLYIAYDINLIKNNAMYILTRTNEEQRETIMKNYSTIAAFSLYIDIVNLFIYILNIFVSTKNRD